MGKGAPVARRTHLRRRWWAGRESAVTPPPAVPGAFAQAKILRSKRGEYALSGRESAVTNIEIEVIQLIQDYYLVHEAPS